MWTNQWLATFTIKATKESALCTLYKNITLFKIDLGRVTFNNLFVGSLARSIHPQVCSFLKYKIELSTVMYGAVSDFKLVAYQERSNVSGEQKTKGSD